MLPILYLIRYIHNVCMKFLKEVNFDGAVDMYIDERVKSTCLIERIRLNNFRSLLMEGVENSIDLKVFSRNCVKFLTKAFSSSDIIEAFTHCNINESWGKFESSYRIWYSNILGSDVTDSDIYDLNCILQGGEGLKNSWKDNSCNFNLLLTYINRYNHEPSSCYSNELKISILKDAKRIIKSKTVSGLCLALKESFQCQPKFYYHNGIKEVPDLSTVLQYYFPEFNKDRFVPRCTDYNGFWWDVDDKTSRIEVLSILIDIYERKLNDENLYYIG